MIWDCQSFSFKFFLMLVTAAGYMPCQVSFVAVKRLYKRENWEMKETIDGYWLLNFFLFRGFLIVTDFFLFWFEKKDLHRIVIYVKPSNFIALLCSYSLSLGSLQNSFIASFLQFFIYTNDAQLQAQFTLRALLNFLCNWCYNLRIFLLLWSFFLSARLFTFLYIFTFWFDEEKTK